MVAAAAAGAAATAAVAGKKGLGLGAAATAALLTFWGRTCQEESAAAGLVGMVRGHSGSYREAIPSSHTAELSPAANLHPPAYRQ